MTSVTCQDQCCYCNLEEHQDECKNLHGYYLGGAICTIIGCLFVIISYSCNSALRRHPSILIVTRCIWDLLFAICLVVTYALPIERLTCDYHTLPPCTILGPLMLFLFSCSNLYFFASILDLYLSLKNPFSSPHRLTNKLHITVISISITITCICRFLNAENHEPFTFRPDFQICFIAAKGTKAINPFYALFVYIPVVMIIFSAFVVDIYAFFRLRRGLPDTFAIRMRSVRDSFIYSVGFTVYYIPLGILYAMIFKDDSMVDNEYEELENKVSNNWHHRVFAIMFGFLGINDVFLWYWRKFRKQNSKNIKEDKMMRIAELKMDINSPIEENMEMSVDESVRIESERHRTRKKQKTIASRQDLKQVLVPDTAANMYRAKSDQEKFKAGTPKSESKFKKLFEDFSFKPNTKGTTINKALRREVLAYTTDGIAQSMTRAKKLCEVRRDGKPSFKSRCLDGFSFPKPGDYPENMNDPHGPTIQKFKIYIQHNSGLLYKGSERNNIVSDSQRISICQCFGSKADHLYHDLNPPTVHDLNRVNTNIVLNEEALDELNAEEAVAGDYQKMGKERQFVDYAPLIFRYIRNKLLHMTDKEYMKSMIPDDPQLQKDVLDAKFGDGKSGAFFYFTHDSRFLVKTIKKHEIELFLDTLQGYVEHLRNNPNTILSRCVGLHALRMYGLQKYFVVMENVFLAQLKPHEIYDLKGSWVGRGTDHGIQSGKVMKDNDLKRFVILNKKMQKQIINQLDKDTRFLAKNQIMDYSLLLGVYHMKIASMKRQGFSFSDGEYTDDDEKKNRDEIRNELNQINIKVGSPRISGDDISHNTYAGGVRAQVIEGPGIYYMGIIDALQKYTFRKKLETFARKYIQRKDGDGISCVDPTKYRNRFMNYMQNIMISGDDYFEELDIEKEQMESQKLNVYPPQRMVDSNFATMRKHKASYAGSYAPLDLDVEKEKERDLLLQTSITLDHLEAIDRIHNGNPTNNDVGSVITNNSSDAFGQEKPGSVELNKFHQMTNMSHADSLIINANLGSLKMKK